MVNQVYESFFLNFAICVTQRDNGEVRSKETNNNKSVETKLTWYFECILFQKTMFVGEKRNCLK